MTTSRITRRSALKRVAAAGLAAPFVFRRHATAAPSETIYHASFGANGMALSDIGSLTGSKHLKLVAVADVDLNRTGEVRKRFPDARIYQDWRELLDKEKNLNSVNVSTPFDYSGPLTESVLLGCLATRFPEKTLEWDAAGLKVTNVALANRFVRQRPRKGWEVEGL